MADAVITNGFAFNNATANMPGVWDGYTAHSIICFNNVIETIQATDNQNLTGFLTDWITTTNWTTAEAVTELTANFAAASVDFIALGPCNWESAGLSITAEVEYLGVYTPVGTRAGLTDNQPAIFTFTKQNATGVRLTINKNGVEDAAISILICGARLDMEKTPDVGYMPGFLNNLDEISDSITEGMAFGPSRVLPRGWSETASFADLPMSWIRDYWPLVLAHRGYPIFFAWNVEEYPNEVIFGRWTSQQITYNNVLHGGVGLTVKGVV